MLNPILASAATRRMRSAKTIGILGAYAAVLLVVLAVCLNGFFQPEIRLPQLNDGIVAYQLVIVLQFALAVLVGPAMTAGAIAGERERQTLELLLVTNTGALRIALGKLLESCAFQALLILSALPVMCVPMVLGGVGLSQALLSALFLMAVAAAASSVGLLSSCIMRTTMGATILSYVLVLLIGGVTLLPMAAGYSMRVTNVIYNNVRYAALSSAGALGMLSPVLTVNPGVGLYCLLESQMRQIHAYLYHGWGRMYATYLLMDKVGLTAMTLISALEMLLAAGGITCVSALLIRPRKTPKRSKK